MRGHFRRSGEGSRVICTVMSTASSRDVGVAREKIRTLRFDGTWRHYQQLALDAFDADLSAGRRRTHIVAPPGCGKTLLGVEIIRRLGRTALVLVPNSGVQSQWMRAVERFGAGPGVAASDPTAPIACLTYQALCQLDDPGKALGDLAERRWAAERAQATGSTIDEVTREAERWTGAAAARRRRELARITAGIKREIARAEHGQLRLSDLLSATARERLETLRENGVGVLVLDECHHLASMWGYVVRAAIEELGDVHVVGLTATPPDGLSREAAELYDALLGPVDFTIPTPAVVRDGFLAPYQELAWITRPLELERAWLAEHDLRFQELITSLHEDHGEVTSLPEWVLGRMRNRRRNLDDDAELSWSAFQRQHPKLARAGARFLASAGLVLPPDVPRGEGYREPPQLEDWLVLLEDYALRCLAADPSDAAAKRYDAIGAALRSLGFTLTRRGIRRGASDVDRLLMSSAAKPLALVEVVGCEYDARGDRLRALVLTDTERLTTVPDELVGVLPADAGTAPQAVRALASALRTAPLRPLLVSGRGLRCAPHDAPALLEALRTHRSDLSGWRTETDEDGLVRLVASGPEWHPRTWIPLATAIFSEGATQVLVGTRALLGEGWDAPCVNCLVDLTSATTSVSVTQMRGRSLRLDPDDPDKIASNWDIVCVAPELARGSADYDRFVRKHRHLFAPSEDGAIEAGPSHVHPALSPFAPPADTEFGQINQAMIRRASQPAMARERWKIGQPYLAAEHETLVVRPRRPAVADGRVVGADLSPLSASTTPAEGHGSTVTPPRYPHSQRIPLGLAGVLLVVAPVLALVTSSPVALLALLGVPVSLGWAAARLRSTARLLDGPLPLDLVCRAICSAYVELGELSERAAASLTIEPRSSGYLRCFLRDGTPQECARFARALDDVLGPAGTSRYLVSRLATTESAKPFALLHRTLTGKSAFGTRWVAVPEDLARNKSRALAFARAWRTWLGPSDLVFTQRSDTGRRTLAAAHAQAEAYHTARRRIWV